MFSSGLGAMVGVLPVLIVGGMAMTIADRMMPRSNQSRGRPPRRRRPTRAYARRRSGPGFGNFSNIGL